MKAIATTTSTITEIWNLFHVDIEFIIITVYIAHVHVHAADVCLFMKIIFK